MLCLCVRKNISFCTNKQKRNVYFEFSINHQDWTFYLNGVIYHANVSIHCDCLVSAAACWHKMRPFFLKEKTNHFCNKRLCLLGGFLPLWLVPCVVTHFLSTCVLLYRQIKYFEAFSSALSESLPYKVCWSHDSINQTQGGAALSTTSTPAPCKPVLRANRYHTTSLSKLMETDQQIYLSP